MSLESDDELGGQGSEVTVLYQATAQERCWAGGRRPCWRSSPGADG